jgi:very-short-patch-repair endonuclease
MFNSANECVRALRQITSHSALLRQEKNVYSDILSGTIPFISEMSPSDIRVLSKSVLIIHQKFGLNLNNYLFKSLNKRINTFLDNPDLESRHSLVSTFSSLSRIHRQMGDGGPPALRPDTVWKFAHSTAWRPLWQMKSSIFDKSELLTVMSRLNLRPFSHLVFYRDDLAYELEPSAIFFSRTDIEDQREEGKKGNGRLIGSLHAMSKLDLLRCPSFLRLSQILPPRIEELSPMELGNTLQAFGTAVGLGEDKSVYYDIIKAVLYRMERVKHDLPLSVVNQVSLINYVIPSIGSSSFCADATLIAEREDINELRSSKAQSVIKKAFQIMGISHFFKEEYPIGPFRIDFAFPEIKLLIEINGPYHYYYKTMDRTTKTKLKHDSLSRRGFTVIDIDYLEMKDESNRVLLLDRKIREALGIKDNKRSLKREILYRLKS